MRDRRYTSLTMRKDSAREKFFARTAKPQNLSPQAGESLEDCLP